MLRVEWKREDCCGCYKPKLAQIYNSFHGKDIRLKYKTRTCAVNWNALKRNQAPI